MQKTSPSHNVINAYKIIYVSLALCVSFYVELSQKRNCKLTCTQSTPIMNDILLMVCSARYV
jgi:hypothetical protein